MFQGLARTRRFHLVPFRYFYTLFLLLKPEKKCNIKKNILQIKLSTSHINHANLFIRREVEKRQNRLRKA